MTPFSSYLCNNLISNDSKDILGVLNDDYLTLYDENLKNIKKVIIPPLEKQQYIEEKEDLLDACFLSNDIIHYYHHLTYGYTIIK